LLDQQNLEACAGGSALRSLVVLILSLHGLHDMFVAGHARRPAIEAAVRRRDRD
jgi:hypothetical protein